MNDTAVKPADRSEGAQPVGPLAIFAALLPIRFIQGFIFWGGGSRRFIYAPGKLDPSSPHWMANKFQSAMPGAILGTSHIIGWLLQHFVALYVGLIVFSLLELLCGLGLIAGFLTRLCALGSVGFSIILMLMFGWQGATCIDEWTMAACNLAIGATLMLAGSGPCSLDNLLLRSRPVLAGAAWFRWICGSLPLPLSSAKARRLAFAIFGATAVFNVGTYSYYRGSVFTAYHEGPTNPSKHHFTLTDVAVGSNGAVHFRIALDAGTPEAPAHVMEAELRDREGSVVERWDTEHLARLTSSAITNDFRYNRFSAARYGLNAEMGASASILLPPTAQRPFVEQGYTLTITDIEGRAFAAPASGYGRA